jgi:hypothetical protein
MGRPRKTAEPKPLLCQQAKAWLNKRNVDTFNLGFDDAINLVFEHHIDAEIVSAVYLDKLPKEIMAKIKRICNHSPAKARSQRELTSELIRTIKPGTLFEMPSELK